MLNNAGKCVFSSFFVRFRPLNTKKNRKWNSNRYKAHIFNTRLNGEQSLSYQWLKIIKNFTKEVFYSK